jgi:hypothetical protein
VTLDAGDHTDRVVAHRVVADGPKLGPRLSLRSRLGFTKAGGVGVAPRRRADAAELPVLELDPGPSSAKPQLSKPMSPPPSQLASPSPSPSPLPSPSPSREDVSPSPPDSSSPSVLVSLPVFAPSSLPEELLLQAEIVRAKAMLWGANSKRITLGGLPPPRGRRCTYSSPAPLVMSPDSVSARIPILATHLSAAGLAPIRAPCPPIGFSCQVRSERFKAYYEARLPPHDRRALD